MVFQTVMQDSDIDEMFSRESKPSVYYQLKDKLHYAVDELRNQEDYETLGRRGSQSIYSKESVAKIIDIFVGMRFVDCDIAANFKEIGFQFDRADRYLVPVVAEAIKRNLLGEDYIEQQEL